MIGCPPVNCRTETIDKKLFINTFQVSDKDIPFKVKTKTTKCTPKDSPPSYRYKCEENAIDIKIKKLLDSDIIIDNPANQPNGIIDYPNFIGQL